MKIESHDITFSTTHKFSFSKTDTFKEELHNLTLEEPIAQDVKEEMTPVVDELTIIRRIKFALIQELMQLLFLQKEQNTTQQETFCNKKSLHVKKDENIKPRSLLKAANIKYESYVKENEFLSFQTQGCVKTSDGKSIDLNLNFTMQRSFYSKTTLEQNVFIDPLVVNLDGELPKFEDTIFSFDLDCDGECDQLSSLAKNNGFLALDKNGNGKIDDGNELFGATNGDGFAQLSKYDEDGNNWIDENDAIFDGLRIWSDDELLGLGEVGLGAIYLGHTNAPFTYKNDANESLAKLQQSSLFLFESGEVGTISQIDIAKQNPTPLSQALSQA